MIDKSKWLDADEAKPRGDKPIHGRIGWEPLRRSLSDYFGLPFMLRKDGKGVTLLKRLGKGPEHD